MFLQLLLFGMLSNGMADNGTCLDLPVNRKCTDRYEALFTYSTFYKHSDCTTGTFCLCLLPIYIRYIEHPPYIYLNRLTGKTEGLLPGNYSEVCFSFLQFHV